MRHLPVSPLPAHTIPVALTLCWPLVSLERQFVGSRAGACPGSPCSDQNAVQYPGRPWASLGSQGGWSVLSC